MELKEFFSKIRPEIMKVLIDYKEITSLNIPERMNSYERNFLIPFWSDELLIENIRYCMQVNGTFQKTEFTEIDTTYNDVIHHKLIHMLLERFEKLVKNKSDD